MKGSYRILTGLLMIGSFAAGAVLVSILEQEPPSRASRAPYSQMALLDEQARPAAGAPKVSSGQRIRAALAFTPSRQKSSPALPEGLIEALEKTRRPLLRHLGPPDMQAMRTEVPMPMNRLVQSAMKYLLRRPEDHVYPWLRRSATYFPMIESIFAEENVPDELKYLALVESGLRIRAESWAGAAGIWQFIPATGRAYGLQIDRHVDERLDPIKATRAAARHLRDLYYLFDGDWLLALAGYNCSPTVIRAALDHVGKSLDREPTYWDIYRYIPRETRAYVPTYIAAALILSNPAAFGLERVLPGPRYAFDYVPVEGRLSLERIARMAGTSAARLRALNPELLRDTLPPGPPPYHVRLPYGSYETFLDRYETLRGTSGDSSQAVAAAPQRVRYSARTLRLIAGHAPFEDPQAGEPLRYYHVRSGDTLYEIASRYDVSIGELMVWNNLSSSSLQPGQRLKAY